MHDVDDATVPTPSPAVEEIEVDHELVLFDHTTGAVHALDRLATIIWRCLDGSTSIGELVNDLADAFDTPEDVVRGDVMSLVVQLTAKNLLDPVDDDRPASPAPDHEDGAARILADPPDP